MKKILIPFLTSFTLLSGCGGGSSSTTTPPKPVSSVASSVASSSSLANSVSSSSQSSSNVSAVSGATITYQAENNFFSGGVVNAGNYLQNFNNAGARVIFTTNTQTSGTYKAGLQFANNTSTAKTLNIYVNGIFALTTTLSTTGGETAWATQNELLNLRKGLNTISYQYDATNSGNVNIDSLSIDGASELATRGATLAYQELEAEDGATNAQISNADTMYLTVESESSGRKFVNLNTTGQYIEWIASKDANALVIRYNMPDAAQGGGINSTLSLYVNGTKIKSLDLSSHFAWTYGDYPFNDNPSNAKGHHFFDESRFSGLTIPAGAKVRLQKDDVDTAAYYNIDLIDVENIEPAYSMPENFVDITHYGAIADDNNDDSAALYSAISAAKAAGKGVWIPAGKYIINGRPDISGIQIRGAGMWYTTLHGINGKGGFRGKGSNVIVADMTLDSDSVQRNDAADNPAFEGDFGTGSLIQSVWVEHMKVGFWLAANTNGLFIVDGRIRDTWADGINFAGGVKNSTVSHFNIRNTGDDAMAMWSQSGVANVNNSFRYNLAQSPALANNFAIYGGTDNKILDNIGNDTVYSGAGIQVSTRFSPAPFAGITEVKRNTLNRTGAYDNGWNTSFGGLWIYAEGMSITAPIVVDTLEINKSTYEGILLSYNQAITNLSVNNVQVNGAGTYGINVGAVTGTGNFSNVTITNTTLAPISNTTYTILRGDGNSGW